MSGTQDRIQDTKERLQDWWSDRQATKGSKKFIVWLVVIYLIIDALVGMYWSQEPDSFNPQPVSYTHLTLPTIYSV